MVSFAYLCMNLDIQADVCQKRLMVCHSDIPRLDTHLAKTIVSPERESRCPLLKGSLI